MGLLDFLLGISKAIEEDDKKKKKKALEDEMDAHGLFDWEKDLVRKGEQDPYDFDEDDVDEFSYYADDLDNDEDE